MRLDALLSLQYDMPRSRAKRAIKDGIVYIDGRVVYKPGLEVDSDTKIDLAIANAPKPPKKSSHRPPSYALDVGIIYEDADIMILNKPSNLIVHEAPSVSSYTLVDYLLDLQASREDTKNIEDAKAEGKNIKNARAENTKEVEENERIEDKKARDIPHSLPLSALGGQDRLGIVHRLDKCTSGALAIAKSDLAHHSLSDQLRDKSMGRYYLAIISPPLKDACIIEANLARSRSNRLKIACQEGSVRITRVATLDGKVDSIKHQQNRLNQKVDSMQYGQDTLNEEIHSTKQRQEGKKMDPSQRRQRARYSKSLFIPLLESIDGKSQLVAIRLYTGRTHQIRAHLSALSRAIIGDTLYGSHISLAPSDKTAGSKVAKNKAVNRAVNKAEEGTEIKDIPKAGGDMPKDSCEKRPPISPSKIHLASYMLYLKHPKSEKMMKFVANLDKSMLKYLQDNYKKESLHDALNPHLLNSRFAAFP